MIIELDKIEKYYVQELNANKRMLKAVQCDEEKEKLEKRIADITEQLNIIMDERETNFEKYYRISFLFMKAAIYTMEQAHDYCHSSRRGLKNSLKVAGNGVECRIQDIALFLKNDFWRALQDDMNSDIFPAISNVINEFSVCANLLDIEDEVVAEIRRLGITHEENELEAALN